MRTLKDDALRLAMLAVVTASALTVSGRISAVAQTPPAGSLERFLPSERLPPPLLPGPRKPSPRFELPPVPVPPSQAPLSDAPIFLLKGVRFQGNTVFNQEELSAIAKPYINRNVSTEDLEGLRRLITLHYINGGYINSGAIIPDQSVANGFITIAIIEGVLNEIAVRGNEHIAAEYIRRRLQLGAGPPLSVRELQQQVQILLQDRLVKRVDVRLSPGTKLGESGLDVDLEEEDRLSARLSYSNSRPPSIGAFETKADIEYRNVTGWGDAHRLTYARTEGLKSVEFETEIPVTARDTLLSFAFRYDTAEVVEQPFNVIDVESRARDYEIGISHPVYRTVSQKLKLGLKFVQRSSETFVLGIPFSFTDGPIDGVSRVSVLRFIQDWLERSQEQVVAVRSTFSKGIDVFRATANSGNIPDGEFLSWLGQVQWVRRVFGENQLIFRGDAQFTFNRLLPLEKYSIGGVYSVRGYRENQLVKDQGYTLSVEGRIPVYRIPVPMLSTESDDGTIELAPFVDFGRAWDKEVANTGATKLFSAGVGLRWRISSDILAGLYYAFPFRDVAPPAENDLQDDGIHFFISVGIF